MAHRSRDGGAGRGAGGAKFYAYQGGLVYSDELAGELEHWRDLRGGNLVGLEEALDLGSGQYAGVHLQFLQLCAIAVACRL